MSLSDGSAQQTNSLSKEVRQGLLESNTKMHKMTEIIQKISDKSNEIHKIVKTIDDIAFQTNILALNAAKETTDFLGETISSMEEGVMAADDTARSMLAAAELAEKIGSLIDDIADNTTRQAGTTAEIRHGIDQISAVVQNTVDTAESSAAASEELSAQAEVLRELVSKFRLNE